ncbi:MAG: DNA polymerase III subunit alpha, partial [bacterium]
GEYNEIFDGNYYFELQNHNLKEELLVNKELLNFSKKLNIPVVATNDCHYLQKQDAKAHQILLCIQTKTTINDPKKMSFSTNEFYFKSPEEMEILFKEVPEAIKNTAEIALKCNLKFEFDKIHLPKYKTPFGEDLFEYLKSLCNERIKNRYNDNLEQVKKRLEYELEIIRQTGYAGYFLVIWDIIRFAREKNIPVGPGRGSAVGSIVSYLLEISSLDPLQYGLIFERFLNPERISMPDIDMDFCYVRREEVINYVKEKYGEENVAQIITFGSMMARAVIRDVGRALDMAYIEVDKIAKMIPSENDITINQALNSNSQLKEIAKKHEVKELLEIATTLEGLTRHASIHAAGIVIADQKLIELLPLYEAKQSTDSKAEKIRTTQYDMKCLEKIGLLKIDFLGLKTLSAIKETVEFIKQKTNKIINIETILFDDKETFITLCNGETIGVFQLESGGMRDLLRKLKPEKFDDLIALLALYRPGTIQGGSIDDFIKRKHKKVKVEYIIPELEEILKETYGVIIYQEQVMEIAHKIGGFSLGQADILRKAMGKKNPEAMDKQRELFIQGAVKNKIPIQKAEEIFDLMAHFAGYGFVKAHSAAYSFIAYQTAYLKTHFPVEFMTSLLTSEIGNIKNIALYVNEAKKIGIKILPPDINTSYSNFSITFEGISFGLLSIKNVGSGAIDSILKIREKQGPFTSLCNFCENVDLRLVNKRVIESLIKCGAFDFLKQPRAQLMAILDNTLEIAEQIQKNKKTGQSSLFESLEAGEKESLYKKNIQQVSEWHESEFLAFEKEMLGLYISRHPLSKFENEIKKYTTHSSQKLKECREGEEVLIAGVITSIKKILDKKKKNMAFVLLEDFEGSIEVIVFSDMLAKFNDDIFEDAVVFVKGKVSGNEKNVKIICLDITSIQEVKKKLAKAIKIKIITTGLEEDFLNNLKKIFLLYPGNCPVYLDFIGHKGEEVKIKSFLSIDLSEGFFLELNKLAGEDKVQVIV